MIRYSKTPIERVIALIAAERTDVSGGGNNRSVSTSYHATLQFEAGNRVELRCGDDMTGKIARGDMGVAYTKGNVLVDFWCFAEC